MTKAVLLHKADSVYDDEPWSHYHFPNRSYLKAMRETVGDWVVYYEPAGGGRLRNGRQAYFALARVDRIDPDPARSDHSYARVSLYQDFINDVPQIGDHGHYESALANDDGSTNAGLRQRAVRRISDADFDAIVEAGLGRARSEVQPELDDEALARGWSDQGQAPYERPIIESLLRRPLRDAAFRRVVLDAYDSTCAFTGLRFINGGGRAEVDAAHIRPVGDNHRGSDSVRNGLALSKTVHWLFDRGIVAVSDDLRILESPRGLPPRMRDLMNADGRIQVPSRMAQQPHPVNLAYHREMFEDAYGKFRLLS